MSKPNYNLAADVVRIGAIVAVILIHTTTRQLEAGGYDLRNFGIAFGVNQITRYAVPLLFMVSGMVLELNSGRLSARDFFQRRLARIAIPYLVWSAIYYFGVYHQHYNSFGMAVVLGNAGYQLYFIPTLVIFYAAFPMLHAIRQLLSKPAIMIGFGAIQAGVLYYDYFVGPVAIFSPVKIGLLNYWWFAAGIAMAVNLEAVEKGIKKWWPLLAAMAAGGGVWVTAEAWGRYYATFDYLAFYSQWRPSVMVYALGAGGLLYLAGIKLGRWQKWIQAAAELTFGVFLVHAAVLEMVWYGLKVTDGIGLFGLTAGISILIIYAAHKIPGAAKIIG